MNPHTYLERLMDGQTIGLAMNDSIEMYFPNLHPCPRNASHRIMGKMFIKTQLAKLFEKDMIARFQMFEGARDLFFLTYDEKKHYLLVNILVETPKEVLITKANTISKRSIDWDAHKVFNDMVHNFLGIDDSQVLVARVIKIPSRDEHWNFTFKAQLENR